MSITLPPGDPVWTVAIWRSDSILLARLRPHLESVINLAHTAGCHIYPGLAPLGFDCLHPPEGGPPTLCDSCQLKLIVSRMEAVVHPTEGEPDVHPDAEPV